MHVIQRIEALMKERNWSQYKLAQKSNLPQTTIANIFNRGTVPSVATIKSICDAFDITLCEFFSEEASDSVTITSEHRRLLTYYDALNESQRVIITELLKHMNA